MDTDEAWERFRGSSSIYDDTEPIGKTALSAQLATMAAAVNNLQTTVSRLETVIPGLQGDAGAIDAANAGAPPMGMQGMGAGMGMGGGMPSPDMAGMGMPSPDMGGTDGLSDGFYDDEGIGDDYMSDEEDKSSYEDGIPEEEEAPVGESADEGGALGTLEPSEEEIADEPAGEIPPVDDAAADIPEADVPEEPIPEMDTATDGGADSVAFLEEQIARALAEGNEHEVFMLTKIKMELAGSGNLPVTDGVVPGAEDMSPPEDGTMTDDEFRDLIKSLTAGVPVSEESVAKMDGGGTMSDTAMNGMGAPDAGTPTEASSGAAAGTPPADTMGAADADLRPSTKSADSGNERKITPEGRNVSDMGMAELIRGRSGDGRFVAVSKAATEGVEKNDDKPAECGDVSVNDDLGKNTESVTASECEENSEEVNKSADDTHLPQEAASANPQSGEPGPLTGAPQEDLGANTQPDVDDEKAIATASPVKGKPAGDQGTSQKVQMADADANLNEGATRKSAANASISDLIVGRIGDGRGFVKSVFPDGVEKSAASSDGSQPHTESVEKTNVKLQQARSKAGMHYPYPESAKPFHGYDAADKGLHDHLEDLRYESPEEADRQTSAQDDIRLGDELGVNMLSDEVAIDDPAGDNVEELLVKAPAAAPVSDAPVPTEESEAVLVAPVDEILDGLSPEELALLKEQFLKGAVNKSKLMSSLNEAWLGGFDGETAKKKRDAAKAIREAEKERALKDLKFKLEKQGHTYNPYNTSLDRYGDKDKDKDKDDTEETKKSEVTIDPDTARKNLSFIPPDLVHYVYHNPVTYNDRGDLAMIKPEWVELVKNNVDALGGYDKYDPEQAYRNASLLSTLKGDEYDGGVESTTGFDPEAYRNSDLYWLKGYGGGDLDVLDRKAIRDNKIPMSKKNAAEFGVHKSEIGAPSGGATYSSPGVHNATYGGKDPEDTATIAAPIMRSSAQHRTYPFDYTSTGTATIGKHIATMSETMALYKSASRPDIRSVTNGDITHDPTQVRKSSGNSAVSMGQGVKPLDVVKDDWAEYWSYRQRNLSQ